MIYLTRYFVFLIVCCLSSLSCSDHLEGSQKDTEFVAKPTHVFQRGRFILKEYYVSDGPHSAQVWCKILIDEKPYEFPHSPEPKIIRHCSLSPANDPIALTFLVTHYDMTGLYLLRLAENGPITEKISTEDRFKGLWSEDGLNYVTNEEYIEVKRINHDEGPQLPLPTHLPHKSTITN